MKNAKTEPIYLVISNDIRKQIFSGALSPGDSLPSENQLCAQYEVSRETVRKALKKLENEDIILSRPKVGYFVSKPNYSTFQMSYTDQVSNFSTEYRSINVIPADPDVRKALELGNRALVIQFLQMTLDAEQNPVGFDVKYIPYRRSHPSVESELHYAVLPDVTLSKLDFFSVRVKIEVSAVAALPKTAEVLRCAVGEPLLLIEKVYYEHDGKIKAYEQQFLRQPYGKLQGQIGKQA